MLYNAKKGNKYILTLTEYFSSRQQDGGGGGGGGGGLFSHFAGEDVRYYVAWNFFSGSAFV